MIKEGTGLWLHYSSINRLHMRSDIPPPEAIQQWTTVFAWVLCSLCCPRELHFKDTAGLLPILWLYYSFFEFWCKLLCSNRIMQYVHFSAYANLA